MASTWGLVLQVTTVLLILMFTFTGVTKLSPVLSPELHGQVRAFFSRYVGVPPLHVLRLEADVFRLLMAVLEFSCAAALAFLKPHPQLLATYVLLVVTVAALYAHFMLGDPLSLSAGYAFGLALVLLRLAAVGKLPFGAEIRIKTH